MPGRTDGAAVLRGLVLALCAVIVFATGVLAQTPEEAAAFKRWEALASAAETQVAEDSTTTDELEVLREKLVAQRS